MALLDVERMNYLMNCATFGVPMKDVCENDDEELFYLELLEAQPRLDESGTGRMPVSEWP